ncbi:CDP-glycerol glycerophosphotransferase family protein [Bacteroidales bacterium OttesenSCG-928-I21]|nr:CDP-glycerol glycerophosphotransferase family protein [Bacteroidales bacterium OttesenSCG-928-I21]
MNYFVEITVKLKKIFNISILEAFYRVFLFKDFFRTTIPCIQQLYVNISLKKQKKTLAKIREKQQVTVVFFLQSSSTWKYDKVYRLMEKSNKFNPIVVICPYNVKLKSSKCERFRVMKQAEQFAVEQGYTCVSAYDKQKNKWVNIKKTLNPDIVFFTRPYKDTLPQYYIYNFNDKITCYTGYSYVCVNDFHLNYNLSFHNLLYYNFVETEIHKNFSEKYSFVKGRNTVVTGAPGVENLIDEHTPEDKWKPQSERKKRIIWAPHHTIDHTLNVSNFLLYSDFMIDLAKKYEKHIQIAFKPHPLLKFRLYELWGEQRTEEYYNLWNTMPNTQCEEGYYIDLFLTSDAMIHDSGSFIVEYLHTLKPVLFTVKNAEVKEKLNLVGLKAIDLHYFAYNDVELEKFINNVVLQENDELLDARKVFFYEYLYPEDKIMPSKKILEILENDVQ